MNVDLLREFYYNNGLKESWSEFIIEVMKEEIIKEAFAGKPTDGYAQAHKILVKSFGKLDSLFETKKERKVVERGV